MLKGDYVRRDVGFQQADLADECLLNRIIGIFCSNNRHQRARLLTAGSPALARIAFAA